jgi:hypothetical protein
MATSAINIKKNNYIDNPKDSTIYTPPEISKFLFDILKDIKPERVVDVCCGDGSLSNPFIKNNIKCIGLDNKDNSKEYKGEFFKMDFLPFDEKCFIKELIKNSKKKLSEIDIQSKVSIQKDIHNEHVKYLQSYQPDLIISNPPFNGCPSKKLFSWEILKRITDIWGYKKPIVLFTLMGLRLNKRYGAKRDKEWSIMEKKGLEISSIISMPIDAFFPGSKTKGQQWEIIIFNAPKIKPHYWFTEETKKLYS